MGNVRSNTEIKKAGKGGSTAKILPGLMAGHKKTNNDDRKILSTSPIIRSHAAYALGLSLTELPTPPAQARIEINTVTKSLGEITAKNIKEGISKQADIIKPRLDALEDHIKKFSPVLKELSAIQIAILKKEEDRATKTSSEDFRTLKKGLEEVKTRINQVNKEKEIVETSTRNLFQSTLAALPEAQRLAVQSTTPTTSPQGPANK